MAIPEFLSVRGFLIKAGGNGSLPWAGNRTAVPHVAGIGKAKSNEDTIGN